MVKVEVDDLRSDVYLGRIHLQQGDRALQLDAQPSDSIALALGTGAPIHVSRRVIQKAGVSKKDLLERVAPPPPRPEPKTEKL